MAPVCVLCEPPLSTQAEDLGVIEICGSAFQIRQHGAQTFQDHDGAQKFGDGKRPLLAVPIGDIPNNPENYDTDQIGRAGNGETQSTPRPRTHVSDCPSTPHMLRHATGFYLANGVDTFTIQAYLGHRNSMHTVRYTQLAPDRFVRCGVSKRTSAFSNDSNRRWVQPVVADGRLVVKQTLAHLTAAQEPS
jgi:hypothetical protein